MSVLTYLTELCDAALYNSLGYYLVALGLITSLRFAGYPDLTADGSFTIGAALFATLIKHDVPVSAALAGAALGGACGGVLTATLNRLLGIGKIVASVTVMLALIVVSPYIAGGATLGLLRADHWVATLQERDRETTILSASGLHPRFTAVVMAALVVLTIAYVIAAKTQIGAQIRYVGAAPRPLLTKSAQTVSIYVALAIGNGLHAIGGALEAQRLGGYSVGIGNGALLIGLTALVLGESLVKARVRRDRLHVKEYIVALTIGIVVYSASIQTLLRFGLTFVDVRLTTTLLLVILLATASAFFPNTARLF